MSSTSVDRGYSFLVDLDRSRSPGAFEDKQNLWRADLQRIYKLVEQQVSLVKQQANQVKQQANQVNQPNTPKLSIAIFGPSGSGKSSLLRTLRNDLQRGEGSMAQSLNIDDDLFAMPVMDPTAWSRSDQFLYAFLAAALEEDRLHQERSQHSYQQGLSPVQLAFQEVNEYLRVLDDLSAPEEPDPLGLSLHKLERHTSGLRLREALSKFVERLRGLSSAELVLLPVDDLDMAPDHLVDSLNVFQGFLTSPRLVPIFTFTDRMPEELIEAYYDRRLASRERHAPYAAPPRPAEGVEQRLSISQQLSLQFLARCFPVRNRILLGPAPARVQRAIWQSSNIDGGDRKVLDLLTVASSLLFGHPDREDAHRVRAALRPSTLRRQLQVFDAMVECKLFALPVPDVGQAGRGATAGVGKLRALWGQEPLLSPARKAELKNKVKAAGEVVEPPPLQDPLRIELNTEMKELSRDLQSLGIGATWGRLFNNAAWSLLNVHRDTLREVGLYLEDLYSWSPVGLRSYVLDNVLSRDQVTQRTLVDRWFNRTDFRRSQILSLLVANVFRPWMIGEEPYGDDERAVLVQRRLEKNAPGAAPSLYQAIDEASWSADEAVANRLTIRAPDGLRWFLGVTLGFYLPVTMARDWSDALSPDEPVKGRMSGSGWDLAHAPINAIRLADAKREILSFGMHFLDPNGYREALADHGKGPGGRQHLLLRIWSCCGYSYGRYWAAISLWRGLSFIGQVLELGAKYDFKRQEGRTPLVEEVKRVIHSHCLLGLVPGSLLNRVATDAELASSEEHLLQAFPKWEPREPKIQTEIENLAKVLATWLEECNNDVILPFPLEHAHVGWKDCFIRRIHGEYILGSLWPRLHSAYLEEQPRDEEYQTLAKQRSAPGSTKIQLKREDDFRWSAAVAAGTWSDLLLEYWRGCPPILWLLLTCPAFLKSRDRFENFPKNRHQEPPKGQKAWFDRLSKPIFDKLTATDVREAVVGKAFCIERAPVRLFTPPAADRVQPPGPNRTSEEPSSKRGSKEPSSKRGSKEPSSKRGSKKPGPKRGSKKPGTAPGADRAGA
jgi:hypothetical protein